MKLVVWGEVVELRRQYNCASQKMIGGMVRERLFPKGWYCGQLGLTKVEEIRHKGRSGVSTLNFSIACKS
jgi:hypothetical protein